MGSRAARTRRLAPAAALVVAFAAPASPAAGQSAGGALPRTAIALDTPAFPTDSGLHVGTITIEVFDVFDVTARSESNALAQAANAVHARTRPTVVRRELLFRQGDRYDPEALRQTERNLRSLGLFRRVEVQALPAHDGVVDVVVRAHDAWSLATDVSFGREGGFNSYDFRIRESNLAGYGVGVSVSYAVGFERRETAWSFKDQRLFASRERLAVLYADRSDGSVKDFSLSRPFYSASSPQAHGLGWRSAREVYRTYDNGEIARAYGLDSADGTIGLTWRVGPVVRDSVWRVGGGYRLTAREYSLLPGSNPADRLDMPASYRWGGPFVSAQFLQHRYEKRSDILAPDRDIDVNFGANVALDLFVSSPYTAPAATSRIVAACAVEGGLHVRSRGVALFAARAAIERGGELPGRSDFVATARAWLPHSQTHATAVLIEGHALVNPDRSVLVYLGGTAGLRGFRENEFAGTRTALVIIEERKFFAWHVAGLVQPGVATFVEVGAIGGGGGRFGSRPVHADAGIGLRLVNLKASGPNVVKVDVAVPFGEPWRSGRGVQLVVGFRREM